MMKWIFIPKQDTANERSKQGIMEKKEGRVVTTTLTMKLSSKAQLLNTYYRAFV